MPSSKEEAQAALRGMMLDKDFGSAGEEVVIEEYLTGNELSCMCPFSALLSRKMNLLGASISYSSYGFELCRMSERNFP